MSLRAAVLGHPIGHSKSPLLHTAAYEHLGVDIDYTRLDVDQERLDDFLARELTGGDWAGWSVTMPLKAALVDHMDSVSARVRTLGVLNTVVFGTSGHDDGRPSLHGENTDVDGIVAALRQLGSGRSRLGETSLSAAESPSEEPSPTGGHSGTFGILGSGGTAAAVLGAAAELGFSQVTVYARTPQRAAALEPTADALNQQMEIRPISALSADLSHAGPTGGTEKRAPAALVSTLPPRAADGLADQIAAENRTLPEGMPLLDVAYDPWPSALAQSWQAAGGTVVSGLTMLLHQAVRQVELFTAATEAPAAEQHQTERVGMIEAMGAAVGL